MKIIIKITNLELTPAINKYIEEKIGSLDKFLSKKFEKDGEIKIDIEIARTTKHHKSGNVFYAEATMRLGSKVLRAENSGPDLRASVDIIKDTLRQSIQKHKEVIIEKKRTIR